MANTTDQIRTVIQRMLEGDERAKGELVAVVYQRLVDLSSRRLRAFSRWQFLPNDTSDVLELVRKRIDSYLPKFVEKARHKETIELPRAFFDWCHLHISYILKDLNRSANRVVHARTVYFERLNNDPANDLFDPPDLKHDPAMVVAANDTLSKLYSLIDELPAEQKEIIQLRDFNDLTFNEIGELLNLDESTIRLRRNKALVALRTHFAELDWQ